MRIPVLLIVLLVMAFFCASAVSQGTSEDEAAIQKLAEKYMEGWKNGDVKTCAEIYAPDADYISPAGEAFKGRAKIEQNLTELFATYKGAEIKIETTSIRSIKPDLAVGDGTWEVTGVSSGEATGPTKGLFTNVLIKKDGEWLVAAGRSRFPSEPLPVTE